MRKNFPVTIFTILITGILIAYTPLVGQAEENISSSSSSTDEMTAAALFHNGYFIENWTNEELILVEEDKGGITQPGGTECWWTEWYNNGKLFSTRRCNANGEGFSVVPPKTIPSKKVDEQTQHVGVGYFEIPARVYSGKTLDNTTLVYETAQTKQKITITANAIFWWKNGLPHHLYDDPSTCEHPEKQCTVVRSKGRGTQTQFIVKPGFRN